jgi:hypothetical protein
MNAPRRAAARRAALAMLVLAPLALVSIALLAGASSAATAVAPNNVRAADLGHDARGRGAAPRAAAGHTAAQVPSRWFRCEDGAADASDASGSATRPTTRTPSNGGCRLHDPGAGGRVEPRRPGHGDVELTAVITSAAP